MNSIAALLEAAEYLERREREAEHGYATSLPPTSSARLELDSSLMRGRDFLEMDPTTLLQHRHRSGSGSSTGSSSNSVNISKINRNNRKSHQGNRSTHNELEKNRRAHLRNCLEKLKDIVPVGADSSRHTTLGLLNKAKHFIRTLEDKDRKVSSAKENLLREQRYLKRRLDLLSNQMDAIHKRRSLSESSATSSGSSNHSSESDEHEVDVIGYGGLGSDDDHSSVRSASSTEGAITTWTKHLTIGNNTAAVQHTIKLQTA